MANRLLNNLLALARLRETLATALADLKLSAEEGVEIYYAVDYYILCELCRGETRTSEYSLWPLIKYIFDHSAGRLMFLPSSVAEMHSNLQGELEQWFRVPKTDEIRKLREDAAAVRFKAAYRALVQDMNSYPLIDECLRCFRELRSKHARTIAVLGRIRTCDSLFADPCRKMKAWLCDTKCFMPLTVLQEQLGVPGFPAASIYGDVLADLDRMRPRKRTTNPTDAAVYAVCAQLNMAPTGRRNLVLNLTEGYVREILAAHAVHTNYGQQTLVRDVATVFLVMRAREVYGAPAAVQHLVRAKDEVESQIALLRREVRGDELSDQDEAAIQRSQDVLERDIRYVLFGKYLAGFGSRWSWDSLRPTRTAFIEDTTSSYEHDWIEMQTTFEMLERMEDLGLSAFKALLQMTKREVMELMAFVYQTIQEPPSSITSLEKGVAHLRDEELKLWEATGASRVPDLPEDELRSRVVSEALERNDADSREEVLRCWLDLPEIRRQEWLSELQKQKRAAADADNFSEALAIQELLAFLEKELR